MNVHMTAHFPVLQVIIAIIGLIILAITSGKSAVAELGKALLWAGCFTALMAAAGSC